MLADAQVVVPLDASVNVLGHVRDALGHVRHVQINAHQRALLHVVHHVLLTVVLVVHIHALELRLADNMEIIKL